MIALGTIIAHFSSNKKLLRELTASSAHISPSFPAPRHKEGGKFSLPPEKCIIWKYLRGINIVSDALDPCELEGRWYGMGISVGEPPEDMGELVQRIKKPKSKPRNPANPYDEHFPPYPEEKMPLGRAAPGQLLSSSWLYSICSSRLCNDSMFFTSCPCGTQGWVTSPIQHHSRCSLRWNRQTS